MPPTDLPVVIQTCGLTGRHHVPCMVIKCKGRGSHQYMASTRFTPFLNHLWVIFKMDVLLKLHARTSIEAIDPSSTNVISETVSQLELLTHEQHALAKGFFNAYTHVLLSIRHSLTNVV